MIGKRFQKRRRKLSRQGLMHPAEDEDSEERIAGGGGWGETSEEDDYESEDEELDALRRGKLDEKADFSSVRVLCPLCLQVWEYGRMLTTQSHDDLQ